MRIDHGIERGAGLPAPAFDFSKVHLYIATPSRGQCTMNFASSMAQSCMFLLKLGVNISWVTGQNDCFPDWSRNKALADFMRSDCTHIWFCDDDMGWNIDAPANMLAKDKDFIAGAGPKKQTPPEFATKSYTNRHFDAGADLRPRVSDGLILTEFIGGAFVILKRGAVERFMDAYPELRCAHLDEQFGYSLFQTQYSRHTWQSEDYTFCERWRKIGGVIWCYPNVSFTHVGLKEWSGNYHKSLLGTDQDAYLDALKKKLQEIVSAPSPIQEVLQ